MAYLGAWGIVAPEPGADIVVTGRVTDASVVGRRRALRLGSGGLRPDRWRRGGRSRHRVRRPGHRRNYSFFTEVPGLDYAGFPLAEVFSDGSSVITKHQGTGDR